MNWFVQFNNGGKLQPKCRWWKIAFKQKLCTHTCAHTHTHIYTRVQIHTQTHTQGLNGWPQRRTVLQLVKRSLAVYSKSVCVRSENLVQCCKMPHGACFLNVCIKPKSAFNKIHTFFFRFRSSAVEKNSYPRRSFCSYIHLWLNVTEALLLCLIRNKNQELLGLFMQQNNSKLST